jgi:DNA-binding SARP family transcriptional activator
VSSVPGGRLRVVPPSMADRSLPYRASACALLMEAFERKGNIAEALRVYESRRGLLREELGAAPSPTVRHMHERLLTGQSVG